MPAAGAFACIAAGFAVDYGLAVEMTAPIQRHLSEEEVLRKLEEARPEDGKLDLRAYDLSGLDLSGFTFRDVVFGLRRSELHANLERTVLGEGSFFDCFFADMELERTDFRHCTFKDCDFRYARLHLVTLADSTVIGGDFYRAKFDEGTIVANLKLELCSLHNARLDGATGLRWQTFARSRKNRPALVHEVTDAIEYARFLERTDKDRRKNDTSDKAVKRRFNEAARVYRRLSELFTSRGEFTDAGAAYARSRRMERRDAIPHFRELHAQAEGRRKRRGQKQRQEPEDQRDRDAGRGEPEFPSVSILASWLWLWIADALCGFGENLQRVIGWMLLLAVLPGIVYWLAGGVDGADGLLDNLLFSTSRLAAGSPEDLQPANDLVEWSGILQTLAGIALIGLFGFILGNKIRNS